MKGLLRQVFAHGVVIAITPSIFGSAFIIEPTFNAVLGIACIATALHLFIKPLLKLLILPLSLATFGLASILVHMLLLYILTIFAPVTILHWQFPGVSLGDIQIGAGVWSYFGTVFALSIWMAFAHSALMRIME